MNYWLMGCKQLNLSLVAIIVLKVKKRMDWLLARFCGEDGISSIFLLISGYFHKGKEVLHLSNHLLLEFYFLYSAHALSRFSFTIPFNSYYLMKIYRFFWPFLLYLLSISEKKSTDKSSNILPVNVLPLSILPYEAVSGNALYAN